MQGISPGIVRGVTSPWMLVGGCWIARIMPIAVETDRLGALMCTIGKMQRPLAVQKEGLHYHTCWAVKDGPPENFCIYNFLRFKRMFFGNTSLIFGHCQQKKTSCPIGLSLIRLSLQRLLSWKLGSASCSQRASGAGNDLQSFGLLVSQGPVRIREVMAADNQEPSKEMVHSLGLVGWMLFRFWDWKSFWCFSCIGPQLHLGFLLSRPAVLQVDEIDADAWHEGISLPKAPMPFTIRIFARSVEKHSKTWLIPSCCWWARRPDAPFLFLETAGSVGAWKNLIQNDPPKNCLHMEIMKLKAPETLRWLVQNLDPKSLNFSCSAWENSIQVPFWKNG